jgi:hypothetical protein
MTRKVLLSHNLQEEETWENFGEIIDEVFNYNFDNPLKVLPTLRSTYSYSDVIFSTLDESQYLEVEPDLLTGSIYQAIGINFLDSDFDSYIILKTPVVPNTVNNVNLDTAIRLTRGTDYTINSENTFTLINPLVGNQYLRVISNKLNTFDISDLYNYGNEIQSGLFQIDFPDSNILNINTATNLETNLPANLNTGFPYNLLIVFLKIEDGSFQYLPPSNYNVISVDEIQILTLPYNPVDPGNPTDYLLSDIRVVIRQPATEVTKKLRQLGFNYDNIEYVTRPSYVDNSHIVQTLADNYSNYIFTTSGTPQFLDYFQYASNSSFEIYKLWAQDNGDLTIYDNLTRENLLPLNFPKVYEVAEGDGGWYPTSHVDLFYDIFTYGSNVDINEVTKFFNYTAPINLVLNSVVFGGNVPPSDESTVFIGGGASITIYID